MLRRRAPILIAVVALHLLVAGWFAWRRPIDGDEGYYGLAARLVAEGRTPYADFFYPQAPLVPYLYAPAAALVGAPQLPDLRLVSVLLSTATIALAGIWLRRQLPDHGAAVAAALLLLALSPELLLWNVTVKTYAWVNLMVVAGLLALDRGLAGRTLWCLAGGCCLGLAVGARLLYAPAALVPAVWLWFCGLPRSRRGAAAWLGGLSLGSAPAWVWLLRDPDLFWFNNVAYHQLRFSELEGVSMTARILAALEVPARAVTTDPGLLVLTVLAAVAVVRRRRGGGHAMPASAAVSLWTAAALTATSLLPDPVHRQYFTGALPVLLIAPAAWALSRRPGAHAGRRAPLMAALAAPISAVLGLAVIRHDLPDEPHWRLDHYRTVSARIAAFSRPDDTVFAFWSGYVAGSGGRPQPGMENHFAVGVSERLDARRRARYHIAGRREIAEAFRLERPRVVVVGAWMNDLDTALDDPQMTDLLQHFKRHYGAVEDIGEVTLALPLREIEGR